MAIVVLLDEEQRLPYIAVRDGVAGQRVRDGFVLLRHQVYIFPGLT
jgi:hypothetical protein